MSRERTVVLAQLTGNSGDEHCDELRKNTAAAHCPRVLEERWVVARDLEHPVGGIAELALAMGLLCAEEPPHRKKAAAPVATAEVAGGEARKATAAAAIIADLRAGMGNHRQRHPPDAVVHRRAKAQGPLRCKAAKEIGVVQINRTAPVVVLGGSSLRPKGASGQGRARRSGRPTAALFASVGKPLHRTTPCGSLFVSGRMAASVQTPLWRLNRRRD